MSVQPNPNVWYSLKNRAFNGYLGGGSFNDTQGAGAVYFVAGGIPLWQFTDPQTYTGNNNTYYALRLSAYGANYNGTDYCMVVEGTNPVLKPCRQDISGHFRVAVASDSGYYYLQQQGALSYNSGYGATVIMGIPPADAQNANVDAEWSIAQVSSINNAAFSTITYGYASSTTVLPVASSTSTSSLITSIASVPSSVSQVSTTAQTGAQTGPAQTTAAAADSSEPSKGWVAGPVIGGIAVIALVVGGLLFWKRRKRRDTGAELPAYTPYSADAKVMQSSVEPAPALLDSGVRHELPSHAPYEMRG